MKRMVVTYLIDEGDFKEYMEEYSISLLEAIEMSLEDDSLDMNQMLIESIELK